MIFTGQYKSVEIENTATLMRKCGEAFKHRCRTSSGRGHKRQQVKLLIVVTAKSPRNKLTAAAVEAPFTQTV